jgi:cytochrome d ubiquinol oxidase subunit II
VWKQGWDTAISISSFLPALLFGVAFGNIFAGLPMDAAGYHGGLLSLLNPYGILTGLLFVCMFAVHGALYVTTKTTGDLSARAFALAKLLWMPLLLVAVVFLGYTAYATKLYANYVKAPVLFIVPLIAVLSLVSVQLFIIKNAALKAFVASCFTIVFVVVTGVAGLFPNLIPSSLDPAYSLTIFNSSSSQYTLTIMTVVVLIFVPTVIAYKIWVYRLFRAPLTEKDVLDNHEAY